MRSDSGLLARGDVQMPEGGTQELFYGYPAEPYGDFTVNVGNSSAARPSDGTCQQVTIPM
jgi:hypothetical protein